MGKKLKTSIVILGVCLFWYCVWIIASQSAYDHSQDAVKAAEKAHAVEVATREKEINNLTQPSQIIDDHMINKGYDSYVVVKVVWDENLGTNRVIGERLRDKHLHASIGKPGVKFVVGQKVKKVTYNQILYEGEGQWVSYFIPYTISVSVARAGEK